MKKTLLIASLMLAAGAQAQLVESGFEDWTDGQADGWHGAKTQTATLTVEQVTENVHGGASAIRLANANSGHQRFTTQPLTVESGTEYTVTFWVRGAGEIRAGIFDDRTTSSGYNYGDNTYVTATATWTQVTRVITAVTSVTNAEFILSVRNTVAPEHLVVDDVTITAGGSIQEVSIHDIQFTTDPSGDSPYNGQVVSTSGIVTAVYITYNNEGQGQYRYTYLQDGSGAWNGVVVFDYFNNNNVAAIGDAVTVVAEVDEYNGLTELTGLQSFVVTANNQTVPAPLVVETGDVASEPLESVLVRVASATCTLVPSGASFGKWNVNDGTGDAVVGKQMYTTTPEPTLGQVFNVTGVVSFGFGEFNIQPRMTSDVEIATGVSTVSAFAGASVYPNPASELVTLELGSAAGQRVEYTLTDATGRTVLAGSLVGQDRTALGVQGLNNGLYHLTLRGEQQVRTLPVYVVR